MADVADIRLLSVDGVPEVRVMSPKPGDMYVISFPGRVRFETMESYHRMWQRAWGEGAPRVMFLQDGAKIELMKAEETGT